MSASALIDPARAFSAALQGAPCRVVSSDSPSHAMVLDTRRWRAEPDQSDDALLGRCRGATVDIGCGPGRLTAALLARGFPAMGIDVVAEAVRQANARGGMALERDVFDKVPGEGRWDSALLADGNIGIGGDPVRLLRRVGEIIGPAGRVIVDVAAPGGEVGVHRVALEVGGRRTTTFRWAVVPSDQIERLAEAAALRTLDVSEVHGRWVAVLERTGRDA
jgi:SAM-dependent methyltransferase